jgi:hypothetical protein
MVLTSGGRHHHPRSVLVCSWPDGSSSLPPSPSLPTRYFNPLDPSRLHPREAAIASFESSSTSKTPIGPQSLIHLFPSSYLQPHLRGNQLQIVGALDTSCRSAAPSDPAPDHFAAFVVVGGEFFHGVSPHSSCSSSGGCRILQTLST